jgi:hypothetical protein
MRPLLLCSALAMGTAAHAANKVKPPIALAHKAPVAATSKSYKPEVRPTSGGIRMHKSMASWALGL